MSGALSGRMPARRKRRGTEGFALIEALVAFAIVSIALGTLLSGISVGLRADRLAKARRMAVRTAQARLEKLGISEALVGGESEGLTDEGQVWRQTVTRVDVPVDRGAPIAGPARVAAYWVEVHVILKGGGDISIGEVKLEPIKPRLRT